MALKNQQNYIFTDEQIKNFEGFYIAIKKVHCRLIEEGYTIIDDKIIKPQNKTRLEK